MIHLLFMLIFLEMALIIILLLRTPLRKLEIMGLDRVKRGRGLVMVKTVAGTIFVVLVSGVCSMVKIKKRSIDSSLINPTDQVLMGRHLLETTLMGFSLFFALIIDRLHHYIGELSLLRKYMEAVKQNRGFEDGKTGASEEIKVLEKEIIRLMTEVKQLESECEKKAEVRLMEDVTALDAKAKQL